MSYLPKEVREGLAAARRVQTKRANRMRLRVGGEDMTILRYWDKGFSVDQADAAHVRGLVDVFDGARHLSRCLVVRSSDEDGETVFEVKTTTRAGDGPPCDFAQDDTLPAGLIGKS